MVSPLLGPVSSSPHSSPVRVDAVLPGRESVDRAHPVRRPGRPVGRDYLLGHAHARPRRGGVRQEGARLDAGRRRQV